MRKSVERVVFTSLLLILSVFAGSTLACTTDGWDGVSGTGVADSPGVVARYSELCAFELSDGSYVESQRAATDARYIARFYVLDGLSGSGAVDILQAYSDDGATSPLFKVSFDGAEFTFYATPGNGWFQSMNLS